MPKTVMHINDNPKRTHPLKRVHAQAYREIKRKIDLICEDCGWCLATYYNKLRGEAKLTEHEARTIASVWEININDIEDFQKGFAKTKNSIAA
jgi:hypothetical protein